MSNAEKVIKIVAASLALFFSVLFGYEYNWCFYHNIVTHHHQPLLYLTGIVAALAPWTFVMPVLALALGLVCRGRDTLLTAIISASWILALAWPLLVICSWEEMFVLL